ncbi:MAG TPA: aminoacyl-tRNA hydrolase [Syntrophobacter fumaroxidans]|nr:aminoacyl-tRNA hydrolase [Syntrophobacter fumaroxidans]
MTLHSDMDEPVVAVVGLGNPGPQYEHTRHNAGFMVVDRLAAGFGIAMQERKFRASWGTGFVEGRKVLLAKPLTYMNLSGAAVGEILKYFGFSAARVLVVHDDLDLPCGRVRLVRKGGAGGHKGIASIMAHLNTRDFPRLKLGIGRPLHGEPVESYVLQPPYAEDARTFEDMILLGEEVVRAVLAAGLSSSMNDYNRKASDE